MRTTVLKRTAHISVEEKALVRNASPQTPTWHHESKGKLLAFVERLRLCRVENDASRSGEATTSMESNLAVLNPG